MGAGVGVDVAGCDGAAHPMKIKQHTIDTVSANTKNLFAFSSFPKFNSVYFLENNAATFIT